MTTTPEDFMFKEIDVLLCEPNNTHIWIYGRTAEDIVCIQTFPPMPIAIEEQNLLREEWRALAISRPDKWERFRS